VKKQTFLGIVVTLAVTLLSSGANGGPWKPPQAYRPCSQVRAFGTTYHAYQHDMSCALAASVIKACTNQSCSGVLYGNSHLPDPAQRLVLGFRCYFNNDPYSLTTGYAGAADTPEHTLRLPPSARTAKNQLGGARYIWILCERDVPGPSQASPVTEERVAYW
jgi:hypothetical protein